MANSGNPAPRQRDLFSFFSSKKKTPLPSPSAATKPATGTASGNAKPNPPAASPGDSSGNQNIARTGTARISLAQRKLLSQITIGTKLAVLWPDDNEFYPCTIHAHRPDEDGGGDRGHVYTLHYDDGEIETIDLATERFKVIGGKKRGASGSGGDGGAVRKKRRIMEESEEDEFDEDNESSEDSGDDSGSEYKAAGGESMDEESLDADAKDEDDWLESEEEVPKKRSVVKKVSVTRVRGGSATENGTAGATNISRKITPTPGRLKDSSSAAAQKPIEMDFSRVASKSPLPGAGISRSSSSKTSRMDKNALLQSQLSPMAPRQLDKKMAATVALNKTVSASAPLLKAIHGEVNPAGSHTHNHLKFFTSGRRDANRNPVGHPDHSPRTLFVDWAELARSQDNGKISPAQKQWWDLKAQYADTVMLFKTGKFYEMFHDDADVGVAVLGHNYMKGTAAHSGFPEAAYALMLGKLVDAGCKVARVEQTETPAALAERKKSKGKGHSKPQVVNREVCSVVSKGTRNFCYLDDASMLERGEESTGPLLAVKEILVEDDTGGAEEAGSEAGTRAVYEYGVTVVNAVNGAVTLGQFADDVLRSRLQTLVARFGPSEVLYEGGPGGASKTLVGFLKSACQPATLIECVKPTERFPKSTAVAAEDRKMLDRVTSDVEPWDGQEAVREIHRRGYYPRSSRSKKNGGDGDPSGMEGISRWPEVLRCCIEGGATLALSSFGAALFYLQRSLVDAEILSMGIVKPYAPPNNSIDVSETGNRSSCSGFDKNINPSSQLQDMYNKDARKEEGVDLLDQQGQEQPAGTNSAESNNDDPAEADIDHMALDGTTLSNLEILHNITSGSYQGSLLSKIDATQSPHGSRLLRAWLLRPLFRKVDIDRRANVVEELAGGSAAMAMADARPLLKKTGDIERLLSRVHSLAGGAGASQQGGATSGHHPNERAILYETERHTRRKVGDFSKLLNGLRAAADIPDLFKTTDIRSPLLEKIVRTTDEGGCFPSGMKEKLDWFFDNFALDKAARGEFEPTEGMDDDFDAACGAIEDIKHRLQDYQEDMCENALHPHNAARRAWKYINVKEDAKDKYLIELPVSIDVPESFRVKAKRGKGAKQVNKYRTSEVEGMVRELECAIEVKNERRAAGMRLVFARFDSMRPIWAAATHATAMLDAMGSLAHIAVQPGFSRPMIVACPPSAKPGINVIQGRHPCVDQTHSGGNFVPNDLLLGGRLEPMDDASSVDHDVDESSVLLLSGPNMGGKSTLLRQTCLITILAQIGSYVPAEKCALTPVDKIFTRLGASDRILCGQSTFFVELAETAAAVRGATRRSLVIMDELGRGTSTFDGTAIASATVKHLVEKNRSMALFATHYHSLLEDWKNEPSIKLGHMECICDDGDRENITFLYTLGSGPCPSSFGVNVARLAGLPDDVLQTAREASHQFEAEMIGDNQHKIIPSTAEKIMNEISKQVSCEHEELKRIWAGLQ